MDVKQIVDYMVQIGTECTHYGNWIFGLEDDLAAYSDMPIEWLLEHNDDIYVELIGRKEVVYVDEHVEDGVHLFNVYFYASFCPMLEEE